MKEGIRLEPKKKPKPALFNKQPKDILTPEEFDNWTKLYQKIDRKKVLILVESIMGLDRSLSVLDTRRVAMRLFSENKEKSFENNNPKVRRMVAKFDPKEFYLKK